MKGPGWSLIRKNGQRPNSLERPKRRNHKNDPSLDQTCLKGKKTKIIKGPGWGQAGPKGRKPRVLRARRPFDLKFLLRLAILFLSILDIELHYKVKGQIQEVVEESTCLVKNPGCQFSWNQNESILENNTAVFSRKKQQDFFKALGFAVRVTISCLTVLTLGLIWWYSELERRLLVVRFVDYSLFENIR